MNYRSHSDRQSQAPRRLFTTLIAICLPILAATFFSGNFFKVGTLQPGEVLDISGAHVAHAAPAVAPAAHAHTLTANAPAAIAEVNIQNYSFQSQSITVNAGDTVKWTNLDPDRHTTTSDTGLWDSGELGQNGTFQFTFTSAGTYGYYCARHSGMRGTITVVGGATTATPQVTTTGTVG